MDVRCESCQTVYEFDDARVKEGGVTVKCTQCGHIFKVRKKAPQRAPRTLPGIPPVSDVDTTVNAPPPSLPPAQAMPSSQPPAPETTADRMWMLRTAGTQEVRRFRDLTTLQQWIVEMKAGREDEISRNGDRWKRIGGIAELEPFFRIVDAARAVPKGGSGPHVGAPQRMTREGDDPAWQSTVPQQAAMRGHPVIAAPPTPVPPLPVVSSAPPLSPISPIDEDAGETYRTRGDDGDDSDLEIPRRGVSGSVVLGAITVLAIAGLVGYLAIYKRSALRSIVASEDGRGREASRKGREYFLLDTDDDFQHADQQFQRAQGADEQNPQPVAALVELNTTWARHLRDDAKLVDASDPERAGELRRKSQARLDEARRYGSEAKSLGPADPEVNRALADLLELDGAPAQQVDEALRRAEVRRSDDPEVVYVRGALQMREGQLDEARAQLELANKLNQQQTQHDLLRADYLLALLDAQAGRRDEAKVVARRILEANPHHVRAAALVAWIESAPAANGANGDGGAAQAVLVAANPVAANPVAANPVAANPSAANPAAPAPAGQPSAAVAANPTPTTTPLVAPVAEPVAKAPLPAAPPESKEPRGYQALCNAGDKMLEHGHGKDAVKLYEKALLENPGGLEATAGLGWALLDTEHYNAAADKFREVLATVPNNGEAIIGLAETYKLRGDKKRALEYFKKYLVELPAGSKAQMAQTNVEELQNEIAHTAPVPAAGDTQPETPLPQAPPSQ